MHILYLFYFPHLIIVLFHLFPVEVSLPLDFDFVKEQTELYGQFTSDFGPVYLMEDEYWCLGDNRPISSDSRRYGAFKKDQISSRLALIFYPFNRFGKY